MPNFKQKPVDGVSYHQPFADHMAGCENYRIPCILTMPDGTLVAAADARWDDEQDCGGIDTVVSRSTDGGKTWRYTFANYFGDNGDCHNVASATFIDPELLADGDRLFMLADLFPGGLSTQHHNLTPGTGFDASGNLRVLGEDGEYVLRDGRLVRDETPVDGITVDAWFYLYRDGACIGNLFFSDAPYRAFQTGYLCLTESDDDGASWSAPQLLNLKDPDDVFLGTAPGRGLALHDGTLLFSAYSLRPADYEIKTAYLLSSNDHGKTWKKHPANVQTSENQLVELSSGTIRMIARSYQNAICYLDFFRNGKDFIPGDFVNTGVNNNSNCMISAVRYEKDGKEYILASCPTMPGVWDGRYRGRIFRFAVGERDSMTLVDEIPVTGEKEYFAYSCMTLLGEEILLLYEDGALRYHGEKKGPGYAHITLNRFPLPSCAE